ncbi:MAG: WD40/YVTN/BNR-like repeat-containing protein [Spirochaetia bacterium]
MLEKSVLLGSIGLYRWSPGKKAEAIDGFKFPVNAVRRHAGRTWVGTSNGIWELPSGGTGNWIQRHDETVTEVLDAAYSRNEGLLTASPYGVAVSVKRDFSGPPKWRFFNAGLSVNETYTNTLYVSNSGGSETWIAGTEGGVLVYTDRGSKVHRTNLPGVPVRAIIEYDGDLWAGTDTAGVWRSGDGFSWTIAASGLENQAVYALSASGESVYAGTESGIFRLLPYGKWTEVLPGPAATALLMFPDDPDFVLAGTNWGGIWYSENGGRRWKNEPELKRVNCALAAEGEI